MPEVVTAGEAMVLLLPPGPGYLRHHAHLEVRVGGAEANTAVGLARLGFRVGFLTRLGQDELGELVLSRLRAEGVEVWARRTEAPTGLYLRERLPGGRGRVHYYRQGSAASLLSPEDLETSHLKGAKVLHLTGITPALSPTARIFVLSALKAAKELGLAVSLDVNYRKKLWGASEARSFLEETLPMVDILFLSEEDGRLWPLKGPDLLAALATLGPREVILKRGKEGSLGLIQDNLLEAPSFRVEEVDPVGAGDAFNAGYLAGLLWGLPPEERLRLGNALGALAVTVLGDYEGAPSKEELLDFLQSERGLDR